MCFVRREIELRYSNVLKIITSFWTHGSKRDLTVKFWSQRFYLLVGLDFKLVFHIGLVPAMLRQLYKVLKNSPKNFAVNNSTYMVKSLLMRCYFLQKDVKFTI